jgi:plastocyanin
MLEVGSNTRFIPSLLCVFLLVTAGMLGPVPSSAADNPAAGPGTIVPIDSDGVQRLTMVLDSYSYSPDHIIVQAGRPVELLLTSVTTFTPHNFILKDEAAGLSLDGDVGAGKKLTLKFTPTQKGTFAFYCDKKLLFFASHREKGMEGKLEVR